MDMDSLLGTLSRTILNYKRTPKGPLIRLKLTVAHVGFRGHDYRLMIKAVSRLRQRSGR